MNEAHKSFREAIDKANGAGSCCGLSWWSGSIQLRIRYSDLCHSGSLSQFDLVDRRLQDCNRASERQHRQLHCWHATATELGAGLSLFTRPARFRNL
jgi:hypothetical protein